MTKDFLHNKTKNTRDLHLGDLSHEEIHDVLRPAAPLKPSESLGWPSEVFHKTQILVHEKLSS